MTSLPKKPLPFAAQPVQRVAAPSPEDMRRDPPDRPLVLTGAIDDYPLFQTMRSLPDDAARLDALARLFGDREVEFTVTGGEASLGYAADLSGQDFEFSSGGRVPFSAFAARAHATLGRRSSEVLYLQTHDVAGWPDFDKLVPAHFASNRDLGKKAIWIGTGGHTVNLHHDWTQNFLHMFSGEKRVTLFPPDTLADLYPAPLDVRLGGAPGSLVRLLDGDVLQRFPRVATALERAVVAEVGPGDVLFIPGMWWHHVESFGLNVMVNTWLYEIPRSAVEEVTTHFVEALALFSDLPARARSIFRDFYRFYLFRTRFDSAISGELVPEGVIRRSTLERVVRHITKMTVLLAPLPQNWRDYLAAMFDYFVFRIHGDPFPTLPAGTYEASVQAMATPFLAES